MINMAIKTNQKGVVLVVALVMLLVMTALGITTMSSSTLQERLSANNRQLSSARLNAESALRRAEEYLIDLAVTNDSAFKSNFIENGSDDVGHYYSILPESLKNLVDLKKINFDYTYDGSWTGENSREVVGLNANLTAQNPRFFIEFVGTFNPNRVEGVQILDGGQAPSADPYVFRITAIGFGSNAEIYSVLQSVFMTAQQ